MSRDRVDALVRLFNCEYREGRPLSAPALRAQCIEVDHDHCLAATGDDDPHTTADPDQQAVDDEYSRGVPEARLHNVEVLPHQHSAEEIVEYFPMAEAAEEDHYQAEDYVTDDVDIVFGPLGPDRERQPSLPRAVDGKTSPRSSRGSIKR